MLLGRSQETKYLQNYFEREANQLIVLYGRENIGKTSFIMDFCKDKEYYYYLARVCSEEEQLCIWANECQNLSYSSRVEPDYLSIFTAITEKKCQKRIIVIDEFQNIVKSSASFMNELVKLIHNMWNNQPVMIVLCSSMSSWVENSMVSKIGAAAYEITGFLKMKELNFLDLVRRFPKYSIEQSIELYGIVGGVPGLWRYLSPNIGIKENICKTILKRGTILNQEAFQFISEELREPAVYHTLLYEIAAGKQKLNELYQMTGFSRAKISVYLKNLMELEIVEKVYSVDTDGRDNTKKGLYRIKNNLIYFWFRFVFPNLSFLEFMTEEAFYDRFIAPYLKEYAAFFFPKVCMEYLDILNQTGKLEIKYEKSGKWVGKVGTIDIVATDEEGNTLAGLCAFEHEQMRFEDYEWLLFCLEQAKLKTSLIYLFTIGGFDKRLEETALKNPSIRLVDLSK